MTTTGNELNAFDLGTLEEIFQAASAEGYFDGEAFEAGDTAESIDRLFQAGLVEVFSSFTTHYAIRPTDKAFEAYALEFQGSIFVEPRYAYEARLVAI